MDHPMTEEESYADRRQLFKNIWHTAINIDDKEGNVINKPKVIKTLRLDEVDRCVIGKKKKQRIKNLRIVCNKLLDFCDRQDTDDMFYEQMAMKGRNKSPTKQVEHAAKKSKSIKHKRKSKTAKCMFASMQNAVRSRLTSPNRNGELLKIENINTSRNASVNKIEKVPFLQNSDLTIKTSLNTSKKNFQDSLHRREIHIRAPSTCQNLNTY